MHDAFMNGYAVPTAAVLYQRATGRVRLIDGHFSLVAEREVEAGSWQLLVAPGLYRLEDSSGNRFIIDVNGDTACEF